MIIESRLGRKEVDEEKIVHFPKGIIGFEHLRKFILLQFSESSPFLMLQSIEDPSLGLLVADPFSFIPEYTLEVGAVEQAILQAKNHDELAVLVTVSIPPGEPDKTALNLLGPILINRVIKTGLQVPQPENSGPSRYFLSTCMTEATEDAKGAEQPKQAKHSKPETHAKQKHEKREEPSKKIDVKKREKAKPTPANG